MEWTYRKIDLDNLPRKAEDVDVLNDAGKEGWELVQFTANNLAYLKRPVAPQTNPHSHWQMPPRDMASLSL